MKCIGENLNIMSVKYGKALKERNAKPLQELAVQQAEAGMDWVDLNIGPAGKMGEELMTWLVPVIHEVVEKPLALDTSNIKAIEAGLKKHTKCRPLINSIMVRPERMAALLPLAKQYDADFVALLWGPEGCRVMRTSAEPCARRSCSRPWKNSRFCQNAFTWIRFKPR